MLPILRSLLAPLGLALCAACSESHAEIVAPYVADLDGLRAKLTALAERMPPPGEVVASAPRSLDPPLILDTEGPGGNAYGLMAEELIDIETDQIPMNLRLDRALSTALHWAGDSRRHDSSTGGDPMFMKEILESARAARYVAVHRVTSVDRPVAIDRKHFEGGWAEIEGVVFDLQDLSIVASYTLRVETPEDVQFLSKSADDRQDSMERFAWSALVQEARREAASRLVILTGGTVRIE